MLRIPLPEYADGTLTAYMVFTNRTRETQTFAGIDLQKYRCAWNEVIFVDLCPRKCPAGCVPSGFAVGAYGWLLVVGCWLVATPQDCQRVFTAKTQRKRGLLRPRQTNRAS